MTEYTENLDNHKGNHKHYHKSITWFKYVQGYLLTRNHHIHDKERHHIVTHVHQTVKLRLPLSILISKIFLYYVLQSHTIPTKRNVRIKQWKKDTQYSRISKSHPDYLTGYALALMNRTVRHMGHLLPVAIDIRMNRCLFRFIWRRKWFISLTMIHWL